MNTSNLSRTTTDDRDPMRNLEQNMKISRFSSKTIKSYLYYNKDMLRFANYKSPKEITSSDIKDYLEYLVDSGKSSATINLVINSLKYYYQGILKRRILNGASDIKRPKSDKKLPIVLSKQEIVRMIKVCENIKHKLMIQILYCSGLRVSELKDLRIDHVDFDRKMILVKQGKGKKDRNTIISEIVLENVHKYLLEYKPLKYLFESLSAGKRMSVRSIQKVVTEASSRAGINKNVSAHTLRHTFATHLLENNVNLRYIQSLLGHARLETTQVYTKVASKSLQEIEDLL